MSGSVWATSVAHSSNNVTNDNLQRMMFAGHQDGRLPDVAIVPSLIGEALVWGAIVGAHTPHSPLQTRGGLTYARARLGNA